MAQNELFKNVVNKKKINKLTIKELKKINKILDKIKY